MAISHSRWAEGVAPGNIGLRILTGSIDGIPSHKSHGRAGHISVRFIVTLALPCLDVIIQPVSRRSLLAPQQTQNSPETKDKGEAKDRKQMKHSITPKSPPAFHLGVLLEHRDK